MGILTSIPNSVLLFQDVRVRNDLSRLWLFTEGKTRTGLEQIRFDDDYKDHTYEGRSKHDCIVATQVGPCVDVRVYGLDVETNCNQACPCDVECFICCRPDDALAHAEGRNPDEPPAHCIAQIRCPRNIINNEDRRWEDTTHEEVDSYSCNLCYVVSREHEGSDIGPWNDSNWV